MAKTKQLSQSANSSPKIAVSDAETSNLNESPFGSRNEPSFRRPRSINQKSGLVFPVLKMKKKLIAGKYAKRIRNGAAVYMSAVLEYLIAEIMEGAGIVARAHKKKIITPRHLMLAIKNDQELDMLTVDAMFAKCGVVPHIESVLLTKKSTKGKKKSKKADDEPMPMPMVASQEEVKAEVSASAEYE